MAYDDFDPEQFKKKNPVEDAFGVAAMQGRMLSSSPAVVAASLGIPADRVEGMDPQSIMRMGRAAARNISAAQQDAIQTQDGKAFNTKEYLANQVGPPDQDPTQLQKQLTAEAGPTQQDQQKHFKSMLDDLRRKVATGDVRGTNIPKSVIDILTFTKKMDAFWAGKVSDATPAALAAGGGPGGNGATAPLPQTGIGPYEKVALSFLFDSDTKILPDYTSMHDAQSMGMAPSTNVGVSARSGPIEGVSRGTDAAGNPSFSNVTPESLAAEGPTMANIRRGDMQGGPAGEPVPYSGTPATQAIPDVAPPPPEQMGPAYPGQPAQPAVPSPLGQATGAVSNALMNAPVVRDFAQMGHAAGQVAGAVGGALAAPFQGTPEVPQTFARSPTAPPEQHAAAVRRAKELAAANIPRDQAAGIIAKEFPGVTL